jgi:hypothetical protein
MFRRGNDSMIVCANGGFAATLSTGFIEGRTGLQDDGGMRGAVGETGALAFTMSNLPDGSRNSPQLGAGWTLAVLDKTDLDHAHGMCSDLEARAWWTANPAALPVATAFTKPALDYATVDACEDAQGRGEYPLDASCTDQLVMCPDGQLQTLRGTAAAFGVYSVSVGELTDAQATSQTTFDSFYGEYTSDGALTVFVAGNAQAQVWHRVAVTAVDSQLHCQ